MKLITSIFLFLFIALNVNNAFAEINEKHSYQAYPYHGLSFKHLDASEFSNSIIRGSMYYQEALESTESLSATPPDPRVDIFPNGTENVIFEDCNLDNIKLPKNSTLIDSSNRQIRVQNDWEDWLCDADSKPLEPIRKEEFIEKEVSIDSKDIPNTKWTKAQRKVFEELLNEAALLTD